MALGGKIVCNFVFTVRNKGRVIYYWFTAKAEWALSVDFCFLLVSSISFLLCPGDGSIYEILRDNQLTNQPFRGFNYIYIYIYIYIVNLIVSQIFGIFLLTFTLFCQELKR